MLNKQHLEFFKIIGLKSTKNLYIFSWHFKRNALEIHTSRPRWQYKCQIDMKDCTILPNHNIRIIPIFYIKQILDKAKPWVCLCKFSKDILRSVIFTEFLEIRKKTTVLMLAFYFAYCFTILYKLVKCSILFWNDFISNNIFLSENGVDILTELYG